MTDFMSAYADWQEAQRLLRAAETTKQDETWELTSRVERMAMHALARAPANTLDEIRMRAGVLLVLVKECTKAGRPTDDALTPMATALASDLDRLLKA